MVVAVAGRGPRQRRRFSVPRRVSVDALEHTGLLASCPPKPNSRRDSPALSLPPVEPPWFGLPPLRRRRDPFGTWPDTADVLLSPDRKKYLGFPPPAAVSVPPTPKNVRAVDVRRCYFVRPLLTYRRARTWAIFRVIPAVRSRSSLPRPNRPDCTAPRRRNITPTEEFASVR